MLSKIYKILLLNEYYLIIILPENRNLIFFNKILTKYC